MKGKLYTVADCENLTIEDVKNIYRRNISPSLTEILDSFSFGNEIVASAEGVWMHTKSGKKILDVSGGGGVLNLGHNPKSVLEQRIRFQESKKSEVHKSFFSPYIAALAHNVSCLMPGDLNYSYFCNSGAEAVEGALKIAYKYHGGKKDMVLHADIAFHGKLLASGNLTAKSKKEFQFQTVLKHDSFLYDDLESVKQKIREHDGKVYALIVEPYCASHLRGLSNTFLSGVRKLCDDHNIVLIFDEIYTGWYKTGPMLSFQFSGVVPDIVAVSKTLGGGKATISAYVSSDKIMRNAYGKVKEALLHSTTYYGYAEECVTAIETLNLLQDPSINGRALVIEKIFRQRMEKLSSGFPEVIEGHDGRGALQGIMFKRQDSMFDKLLRMFPTDAIMGDKFIEKLMIASVTDRLFSKHNIHCVFGAFGTPALLFSPSLVIKDDEIHQFFDGLEDVLSEGTWELVTDFSKRKLLKKLPGGR